MPFPQTSVYHLFLSLNLIAKFIQFSQMHYNVAAIALRNGLDGREVLLMQEAKKSCRGQWYLPSGKVEPGETIEVCGMRERGLNKINNNSDTRQLDNKVFIPYNRYKMKWILVRSGNQSFKI
jgi:hypothetical protein